MKNMIRMLYVPMVAVMSIAGAPATAGAQNPDLSGEWILNESESQVPQLPPGGARGGGRGGAGAWTGVTAPEMTITQSGDQITFDRRRTEAPAGLRRAQGLTSQPGPQTLQIDGKPHQQDTGRGASTTVAEWKEGKLVVVQNRTISAGGQTVTVTTTTVYALSPDGRKLTLETSIETGRGPMSYQLVYDRKS